MGIISVVPPESKGAPEVVLLCAVLCHRPASLQSLLLASAARSCVAPFYRWLCLEFLGRSFCLEGSTCLSVRVLACTPLSHTDDRGTQKRSTW
jgi:hypothetical protein